MSAACGHCRRDRPPGSPRHNTRDERRKLSQGEPRRHIKHSLILLRMNGQFRLGLWILPPNFIDAFMILIGKVDILVACQPGRTLIAGANPRAG